MTRKQDERRSRPRTTEESHATGLVQAILEDPRKAAADLERDLQAGGDLSVILALLSAAETMGLRRGLNIQVQTTFVRDRLRRWKLSA